MTVTSVKYFSFQGNNQASIIATIDGQELSVPLDPANRHYAAILEWVADGNKIEEAD